MPINPWGTPTQQHTWRDPQGLPLQQIPEHGQPGTHVAGVSITPPFGLPEHTVPACAPRPARVQVLVVLVAGAAVVAIISLGKPVIDNTINSFPRT